MIVRTVLSILLLCSISACSHKPLHEKDYQAWWCHRHDGELEYRLPDGTRVDCLLRDHAVEVEFAPKWAEAIGQALYYAQSTDRKPGVLLVMRDHGDERYLKRLRSVARQQGIKVWTIRPQELE